MQHTFNAEFDSVGIRPLSQDDLEYLRNWRNDEVISKYLTKLPYITREMQNKWYKKYLEEKSLLFFRFMRNLAKTRLEQLRLVSIQNPQLRKHDMSIARKS